MREPNDVPVRAMIGNGVLLNSALFLGGCLAASIWLNDVMAWRLTIIAVGLTYLCYVAQLARFNPFAVFCLVSASNMFGAFAMLRLFIAH